MRTLGRQRRRHRSQVLFAGADADHLLDRQDEDLAVSDLAGAGGLEDGVDRDLHERIGDADVEAHLLDQLHLDRRAAVGLDLLGLASVALGAADGEAADLGLEQRLEDLGQLLRPDDGGDQLHAPLPSGVALPWEGSAGSAGRPAPSGDAAGAAASGSTRMAPSPLVCASSPCWGTSSPIPSWRRATRSGASAPTALSSANEAAPL